MRLHHVLVPSLVISGSLAGALLSGSVLPGAAFAGDVNATVEATLEDAYAKDQILGVLNSTANELHVTFTVPAGSSLGLTGTPDTSVATGATGLAFSLCAPDGSDMNVAGSEFDKSKDGKDKVKWKKVPLETFGTYTLVADAQTAGGMLMKLSISDATAKVDVSSTEDLALNDTATVEFDGRAGDKLKFDLRAEGKGSKFVGELFQILRPDGTAIPDPPVTAKGNVVLDADGTHKLLFTNVGKIAGGWRAKLTVKPRAAKKRKGLVSAAQTGLVPKVSNIDPSKGFNRDTALRVTMIGKGFQPGLDIRLVRKNRLDILADSVDFISSEEVSFVVDLDTNPTEGKDSIGTWKVSVWNAPIYGVPGDRTTLDRSSPLFSQKKKLSSVSSGSVKLPNGVEDDTEVWQLVFADTFQNDLDRMGLGSEDVEIRDAVNTLVRRYVIANLRDLFVVNETNGSVKGASVPICVVEDDVTAVAGLPGVDYNRIEIGGAYQEGDPRSTLDPLEWGFAERDVGNQRRDDLMRFDADGNRLGLGARIAVLDARNGNGQASSSWRQAMEPLRVQPLTNFFDRRYFTGQINRNSTGQLARYADIVNQIERAAREIAAIVAHHMGRAMGLATAGEGPMASPSFSGEMWRARGLLKYADGDLATLRLAAVPHQMPGKSDRYKVTFFPVLDLQPVLLIPNAVTGTTYDLKWNFVGGRCNALPADYRVSYARGSEVPLGLILTFQGLSGTPPTCINGQCIDISSVYCGVLDFALLVDDIPRNTGSFLVHRLKMLPNVPLLPAQLQTQAQNCLNAVLQAQ